MANSIRDVLSSESKTIRIWDVSNTTGYNKCIEVRTPSTSPVHSNSVREILNE